MKAFVYPQMHTDGHRFNTSSSVGFTIWRLLRDFFPEDGRSASLLVDPDRLGED